MFTARGHARIQFEIDTSNFGALHCTMLAVAKRTRNGRLTGTCAQTWPELRLALEPDTCKATRTLPPNPWSHPHHATARCGLHAPSWLRVHLTPDYRRTWTPLCDSTTLSTRCRRRTPLRVHRSRPSTGHARAPADTCWHSDRCNGGLWT